MRVESREDGADSRVSILNSQLNPDTFSLSMYALARLVQFAGLVVAGSALFVGVMGKDARRELMVLGIGAAIFLLGYMLQRTTR